MPLPATRRKIGHRVFRAGRSASMAVVMLVTPVVARAVTPVRWSKVDGARDFGEWREHLADLARSSGKPGADHFCTVVADHAQSPSSGPYRWAYVYWRETAQLFTFGPSHEKMSDLTRFKQPLDLHKDVVASERQVGGSTFLVTRAWVSNVLSHCARSGTQLVVKG